MNNITPVDTVLHRLIAKLTDGHPTRYVKGRRTENDLLDVYTHRIGFAYCLDYTITRTGKIFPAEHCNDNLFSLTYEKNVTI